MLASRPPSSSAPTHNPHSTRCQPAPNCPRLRALALFGRRFAERAEGLVIAGVQKPAHVWTAPSWQGESSRRRLGSMQPCVRPLRAVHMTAGHNALRGSGPGQKPAFENAVAHVGCPDRRIDRLCITCCSPSQPSHHAMVRGAISSDPQRGWIIVSLAPSHHGPGHSGELVG